MPIAAVTHSEPVRATVVRNAVLALVAGTALTFWSRRSAHPVEWPFAVILALWPTFGGHWIEVWYLNWLRPRLPGAGGLQRPARAATWFFGGCLLGAGVILTAHALNVFARTPAWWLGGVAFVGLELAVHAALHLRGQPSLFNDRS